MSSRRATHPVNLEVIIHSQQLEAEAGAARCWLVTLRTRLGGEAAALGQLATACDVTGQRPDELSVAYLGQPDDYCTIYQVTETTTTEHGRHLGELLAIQVRLTPRYHPSATTVYRLDKRLAALVGRDYLAHPKYALTVLLAYARAKCLSTPRSILCDRLLAGLLGCPWVRNKAVWNKLSGLMTRVTVDTVNLEHSLLTGGSSSIAVMELSADAQQNLYPAKWIHNGLAAALITRSHTDGALPPSATKTAVKSKRLLRRHKSI